MTDAMPKVERSSGPPRKPCQKEGGNSASDRDVKIGDLKYAMGRDYRETGLSKAQVAEALAVSEAVLNDWLAASKCHHRIPAERIDDWCRVTGSDRLLRLLLRGLRLEKLLAVGEAVMQREHAEREYQEALKGAVA